MTNKKEKKKEIQLVVITHNRNGSKESGAWVVMNNWACHRSFTGNWRVRADGKLSNVPYH